MKKIIELIVKLDDIELDGAGVDAIALVENPAIEMDFLAFNKERNFYVDNEEYMQFKKFLDENKDLMKKPGGGPAGEGGVDHGAQMSLLEQAGISTEYPFGYCFQIAQFVFYALGGYKSQWDLMCIKGMQYQVAGNDFQSTHWYVQNKETGQIVDLSAEQFEGILDINEYYEDGRRANLGFPYYNVDGKKVMFDNTVPSIMTLKLYNKWKEEGNGELEGIEEFYQACQYEKYRMHMQFSEEELPYAEYFVKPNSGESESEFIGRCIPVLLDEGYEQDQAIAVCYSYWEDSKFDFPEDTCWEGYEPYGTKIKDGREVPNCIPVNAEKFESYNDYPESAKNAAKRALEWRDANPDQGCGTPVGWARANQLAKGENISEETIARMASFARHLQHKDVPYSEGCGGLMVDAWGGQAGIEWAQNKLEQIRGEFDINVQAAPYVDQIGKPKKKEDLCNCQFSEELSEEQKWILSQCEQMGEEYDPHEAIFVSMAPDAFNTVTDTLKAISALDVLGKIAGVNQDGETVYRYAGPTAERGFCRAMLRLNKVYRPNEVAKLNSANPGFGRGGSPSYSVLKYKGGPNCTHYFEYLTMFKSEGRTIFLSHGPVNENTPGAQGISAADKAAAGKSNNQDFPTMNGAVANNAYVTPRNFSFSVDDEKRIVVGPAMVPNKMILRRDELGNPYYVYFKPETVKEIAEKVFAEDKHNMTNAEHQSEKTHTRNTLLESWIVEDPEMDKAKALGFDVPKDTWMVSYKINDDKMWQDIKDKKLKGFSVEGYFVEKAEAVRAAEQTYNHIVEILNQVK